MFALRRHRRLLRTALLVLLALGMVIKPTLGALGELHAAEHAVIADADDGHGHAHPVGSGHDHGRDDGGGGSDPDHAAGTHGLLHQAATASVTLPESMPSLVRQTPAAPHLPETGPLHLPGDTPDLPFRPPIG